MDEDTLCDLLPIYYTRLFPYTDYYRWLSYGEGKLNNNLGIFLSIFRNYQKNNILVNTFSRREFSFTLRDEIYVRFKAFKDLEELKVEIKRLLPHKIDIGAVYNVL